MKSLSAIARELGVSVATVSYVYNDKWRENRIHPDLPTWARAVLRETQVGLREHEPFTEDHAALSAMPNRPDAPRCC